MGLESQPDGSWAEPGRRQRRDQVTESGAGLVRGLRGRKGLTRREPMSKLHEEEVPAGREHTGGHRS